MSLVPASLDLSLRRPPLASVATTVLIVDSAAEAARNAATLRDTYHVATATTTAAALECVRDRVPTLAVVEFATDGIAGTGICKAAKSLSIPSTVLVTTTDVERVPEALVAGCDAVLLKPFQPNLLHARLGRLLRSRAEVLRRRARLQAAKAEHLVERSGLLACGTNRHWPAARCPHCSHRGVTSFDFASHRRMWYACLACRKVWIAKPSD